MSNLLNGSCFCICVFYYLYPSLKDVFDSVLRYYMSRDVAFLKDCMCVQRRPRSDGSVFAVRLRDALDL